MALPPSARWPSTVSSTRGPALRGGLVLALLTLLGFGLRLPLLDRFPFHQDEAIYSYWALHGWTIDPLFLHVWPDKPPLFLWLLGAAFQLWGHSLVTAEPAARYVNIVASTLTIPVLAVTARYWWGQAAGCMAAVLAALSPFAISFGPTAFTDPVLVLAGALALLLAARGRWLWSGVWLGAAIMTKQQGLLLLPLVACAWWSGLPQGAGGGKALIRALLRLLGGAALVVVPILYWDSLRWSVAPSPWDLGAANVGGVAALPADMWADRAAGWWQLTWYLLAAPWTWVIYGLALVGAVWLALRRRAPASNWGPALLLGTWTAGFLILHVVTNVQVWDRYLLPLVTPLALLGGWAAGEWVEAWRARAGTRPGTESLIPQTGTALPGLMPLLVVVLIAAAPAWEAAQGQLPIGSDHGDYAGIDQAMAAVSGPDVLLFHRELGWHARFALFDAVRSGEVELRYYPSSVYLTDSATKSPHKQRYVIVPDWSPIPDLPLQLRMRGLQAQIVLQAGRFTVYRIDEIARGDTSWRVCRPGHSGLFTLWEQRAGRNGLGRSLR